jgi:hypothetical protein
MIYCGIGYKHSLKTALFVYNTLGFVVVVDAVVDVVDEVVMVAEVVVIVLLVVVIELDVVDGLESIVVSISVDEMVKTVSIGGVFSELDNSGGAAVISGTVIDCAPKVVTSSICFVSVIPVVGAVVSLALARKVH